MFHHLGSFVSRHWLLVILGWLALAIGINFVAPAWDDVTHDGDLAYLPENMTSVRGEKRLMQAFPDTKTKSQIVLVVERPGAAFSEADLLFLERLFEAFQGDKASDLPVVEVWDYNTKVFGSKLLSPHRENGQAALVTLQLSNEFMATDNIRVLASVQERLDELGNSEDFPEGLKLGITGSAAIGGDMLSSAQESIKNTELATVILVLVILLLVYRAPLLVIIPLATIAVSVAVASDVVALVADAHIGQFKIFKTTRIFVVVILFGAGVDYCLFLISRYKEELELGLPKQEAIQRALGQVGDALVASALTTIVGLGMMYFADFGKFRYSGPAIAMCLSVALLACLTLAPALLSAVGVVVFWPFGIKRHATDRGSSGKPSSASNDSGGLSRQISDPAELSRDQISPFWNKISGGILKRPGLILVVSVALLSFPAYYGWAHPRITYNLLNELRHDRASVQGTEMLRRHFAAGDTGPLTVLIFMKEALFLNPESDQGELEIALLTKELYDMEGIVGVRSYSEPLGDKPGLFNPLSSRGRMKMAAKRHPRTKATYFSEEETYVGRLTRLDLILQYDPFSEQAAKILARVNEKLDAMSEDEASPWYQAEFDFVGTTASKRDLQAVTESDQVRIQQLVLLAVFIVLVVILRRPLICTYLILSVLFSYFVTLGITEFAFEWFYGATFEGLDWKVPIFLFVILVAVGEDYNIYLVTRVIEEQKIHGPVEGLRWAVVRTGGIITSCGLIMAGTFISMMSGTLRAMLELGFALSLGVILDTFIVRPILVPAFLALLYRGQQQPAAIAPTDEERPSGIDVPGANGTPSEALSESALARRAERAAHR